MNTATQTKPKAGEFAQAQGQPPVAAKPVHPLSAFKDEIEKRSDQLKNALPPHIPVERFIRVVLTALQNNPKLLKCTQQSLWNSCMKAAQDGLLPDGREGAIVPYGENDEDGKKSADIATWMPMIAGLRKKVRNSGEIITWEAHCVYEADDFDYQLGDDPFIRHKPALGPRGKIIAAYSVATLKDGYKSREVMSKAELDGVRSKSKAKKGPWSDPIFEPEMYRKTVARRHYKVLPQSTDLDDLMRNDDELYDFSDRISTETPTQTSARRLTSVSGSLDAFAGQTIEAEPSIVPDKDAEEQPGEPEWQLGTTPATSSQYVAYVTRYFEDVTDTEARKTWLASAEQRKLRSECKVTKEHFAELQRLAAGDTAPPDPDQDPEAYLEFLRGKVKEAKNKADLTALRENFVAPFKEKFFPPDIEAVDKIFADAEKGLR